MGLPQYGGEGKKAYKKKMSDMKLPQHGGEGKHLKKGSDIKFSPSRGEMKDSPGRKLGKVSY